MWLCLAVAGLMLSILSPGEAAKYRIIAGRKASALEFPYQAELEKNNRHWCGGSIIHKRFILTASHCIKDFEIYMPVPRKLLSVRVGNDEARKGGQVYEVAQVIPHEKYVDDAITDQYDIGLLRLSKSLELSETVAIVPLSTETPKEGQLGWVAGFGKQNMMRSNGRFLMAVELPVVSLRKCRRKLLNVANDMICAGHLVGNRDACTGDSGGPYVVEGRQVGVVAWGIGCGREGLPGVYTNVAKYRDWISNAMSDAWDENNDEMHVDDSDNDDSDNDDNDNDDNDNDDSENDDSENDDSEKNDDDSSFRFRPI